MPVAAVVLAGGASRRMGRDKLSLPRGDGHAPSAEWAESDKSGEGTVLSHVVQVVSGLVDTVHLVIPPQIAPAPDFRGLQNDSVQVVIEHDQALYRGPLQALNGIWGSLMEYELIYVVAGDLPGLATRVLETCKARLEVLGADCDGVAVVREQRWQPLVACYRPTAGRAWSLAENGELRILRALDMLCLGAVDEHLQGWPGWWTKPIHTPEDYAAWLEWHTAVQDGHTDEERGASV